MSDPKRGGSRDISELKQRLGLKKGAAPGAQPRPVGTAGVLPPPGMMPPPGMNVPAPAPPPPAIPNAADDPFGAMNAMAAVGTVQRAPEIVIVNDGKPVENVGASGRGASIAKVLVPVVAALVLGVGIGQIAKTAHLYNDGLKDARAILGDDKAPSTVRAVKRALSELDGVLDEMKTKNDYHPDTVADTKIGALAARLDVKAGSVFRTASAVDPDVSGQIMAFYAGVAEVKGMLDTHQKSAKFDDLALSQGKAAGAAAQVSDTENAALAGAGAIRYGALIQAPTTTDPSDFGVRIVELGPPYCGTALSTTGKCDGGPPSGYAYRSEPGSAWKQGDLQAQGSDSVPTKKLLLLLPTGTRDALVKGSQASASEVFYAKRLRTVAERTKKLIDDANKLEQRLQAESSKGARFSFFL